MSSVLSAACFAEMSVPTRARRSDVGTRSYLRGKGIEDIEYMF